MDARFYRLLRESTAEEFYNAINDPEDELYDVLWDLFEKAVIEPGEVFDPDFRDRNQFRFSIDTAVTLEFFPESDYYTQREDANPYQNDGDAAGIHLQLSVQPSMSCLFSVAFLVWGAAERQALRKLWYSHRKLLSSILSRIKPMVSCRMPFPSVEHSSSLEEMLDNYFLVQDAENYLSFQYSFAQTEDADAAQKFMACMAMLYHVVRASCQDKRDLLADSYQELLRFHGGRLPEIPHPLPCVEMPIAADIE